MKREFRDYLNDLIEAIDKIENFIRGFNNYEDFSNDEKTFLAVVKLLENIGEAVKNIPDDVRLKYPNIPWKEIAGMRDILAHEYFGIDAEVIWLAAVRDIQEIKPLIQGLKIDYGL